MQLLQVVCESDRIQLKATCASALMHIIRHSTFATEATTSTFCVCVCVFSSCMLKFSCHGFRNVTNERVFYFWSCTSLVAISVGPRITHLGYIFEHGGAKRLFDIIRDSSAKVQQPLLTILHILFISAGNIPAVASNTALQEIIQTLKNARGFYVRTAAVATTLVTIVELGGAASVKAKSLLVLQSLSRYVRDKHTCHSLIAHTDLTLCTCVWAFLLLLLLLENLDSNDVDASATIPQL